MVCGKSAASGARVTPQLAVNDARCTSVRRALGYRAMQHAPSRVRVYGWLFDDDPVAATSASATGAEAAWQIHPVTCRAASES